VASWPLTLLRKSSSGAQPQTLETTMVISLCVSAFVPIFELRDHLARSMALMLQLELVARVCEVCVDDQYDNDKSLGDRLLHSLVPPEELERRKPISGPSDRIWATLLSEGMILLGVTSLADLALDADAAKGLGVHQQWLRCALYAVRVFASMSLNSLLIKAAFLGFDKSHVRGFTFRPHQAASVRDFWSRRWNLPMHHLLHRLVFVPLTNSRIPATLSAFATFMVSAAYHVAHLYVGTGSSEGAFNVFTYFALQELLIVLESSSLIRIGSRTPLQQTLWVALGVLGPISLFATPFLRLETNLDSF